MPSTATVLTAAAVAVAATGAVRQRREAAAERRGELRRLGPDGTVPPRADRLHARIADWVPTRPTTRAGRVAATAWAGPATLAGTFAALVGGRIPRPLPEHGCLLAAPVGGPTGALLRQLGAGAATIGHVVVARGEPSALLLTHEAVHARQHERLGPLFPVAYGLAQARWGYRANPFEVAARRGAAVSRPPDRTSP